ncbi:MAG: InlB B-repeat-containing protein [Bacilli bacterium]|nr:InlB B-repeat-containing protein [Bacilli bacterium]
MKKVKKTIVLLIIMILSIIHIGVVKADTKKIVADSIKIKEKSETITVATPGVTNNEITSNVTFNQIDDFVTFELNLKNNESEKYKIGSIKDNNKNENISIEYTFNENYIKSGDTIPVTIKMRYKNKLLNEEKVSLNDLQITISLVNEDGKSENLVINPATGDNIFHYLVLLIIALAGIVLIIKNKRIKGFKVGNLLLLFAVLLISFSAFAKEQFEMKLKFTNIDIKGEFEEYNITINYDNGNEPIIKKITYGDKIGTLPTASKEGYTFNGWKDQDGNDVTEDTVVKGKLELKANYTAIKYNITYNLNGGKVESSNKDKYTIEDEFDLVNPTRKGYTFSGWTGSNGESLQTRVTINRGETGNKEFTANWSTNEDTPYKVIHKYEKLDGTYEEVVENLKGATDTTVVAPIKHRDSFVDPKTQNIKIEVLDDLPTVTYIYERENYSFGITDRTYIDNSSTKDGSYPYETEITVKAKEREGYTFKWNDDNNTEYERTFKLEENKEITPIYTPNTNTKYTVVHKYEQLDGTYKEETEQLEGTTDTKVTPEVVGRKGYTSPETITEIVSGDGKTKIEYTYTLKEFELTVQDYEYIEEGNKSGTYKYGEEITLTAKTRENYTFSKWSNDSTTNPLTITITSDITINPIYNINKFTVTYNPNEGNVTPTTQEVNAGKSIDTLPMPTKTNYYFDGWYTGLTDGIKVTNSYIPSSDITLYARWIKSIEGATIAPSSVSINVGETTTLRVTNIEEEYTYKSNDTSVVTIDSDGKVTGVGEGTTTITITGTKSGETKIVNVEISKKTYTVTFNTNGGTNITSQTIKEDEKAIRPSEDPTKSGYNFIDWYTTSSYTKVFDFDTPITSDITIYARFVDSKYVAEINGSYYTTLASAIAAVPTNNTETTIKILKDIEELTTINQNQNIIIEGGKHTISNSSSSSNKPVIENNGTLKLINGIYTSSAKAGVINNNSNATLIIDDVTISAKGLRQGLYNDGGKLTITGNTNITSTTNERAAIQNKSNGTINIISGNITSINAYAIYNENGKLNIGEKEGTVSSNTPVIKGETYGVVANSKYNFYDGMIKGKTASVGTTSDTGNTPTVSTDANKTKIAEIEEEAELVEETIEEYKTLYLDKGTKYKVTFNANGESVSPTLIKINIGDSIDKLPTPTIPTAKVFEGWYTEQTDGEKVEEPYTPTKNITLYARYKKPEPSSFKEDDWSTIVATAEGGDLSAYSVGDTKTLQLDMDNDGKKEDYILRIANKSTPEECNSENYSQTACGFVIEFKDIITKHRMNPYTNNIKSIGNGNIGGWESSELRTYLNNDIYNMLPSELKRGMMNTKALSGRGYMDYKINYFTTEDKLYLFSTVEIWGTPWEGIDTVNATMTRQLDYYKDLGVTESSNNSVAIKNYNGTNISWWLRASTKTNYDCFNNVSMLGAPTNYSSDSSIGVSPAFRIGKTN